MTAHPIDTEALRRFADAATPGPWVVKTCEPCAEHGREDIQIWDERGQIPIAQWMDEIDPDAGADAEFIAAAREAVPALLDALAAAEHRIARLEAQSDIRGRAVVIYRDRAREAEAERDWNIRSSRLAKEERIKANARAEKAEARIRDLTQEVRDERGAALDALEQIKVRDARIKAVEDALSYADMGETLVTRSRIRRALDGDA